MKRKTKLIAVAFLLIGSIVLTYCKKDDTVTPLTGTPVTGNAVIDTNYYIEKSHSAVEWETRYRDYSNTLLTGRFNDFGFGNGVGSNLKMKPNSFRFDQSDMSKCYFKAFARSTSSNTGEPGRDALTGCGKGYFGVVFTDSIIDAAHLDLSMDTAWFESISFTPVGTIPAAGYPATYVVKGNLTFNHYRPASGNSDRAPITKQVNMYLTYNGALDMDSNKDGVADKLYRGFSGKFSFNRSDFMDINSTVAYNPFPKKSEVAGQAGAAGNKTYGVWSTSAADNMDILLNIQMYQKH